VLQAAWDALWDVMPAGWTVARPQHNAVSDQWTVRGACDRHVTDREDAEGRVRAGRD
jgi:hypothetical protein